MIEAWFWWAATSYLTLGTLGIAVLVAAAIGYFPLARYAPIIGVYVPLAKFLAVFGALALAFIVGARFADERAELASLQVQIARQNAAAEQHTREVAKDAAQLQAYDEKVKKLEGQISKGICLPDADANKLRQLWKK